MFKLAWRNLWRNKGRTIIILSAIALTYSLALAMLGIQGSMYGKMERGAAKTAGGNILVHGDGYWDAQSTKYVVKNPSRVVEEAEKLDGVERIVTKVHINGLLTSPRGNTGVRLSGVIPEEELELENWARFLSAGDFLGVERPPTEARFSLKRFIEEAIPIKHVDVKDPIVLGVGVVETLGAKLGDRIVLTTTREDGEVTRALFRLSGVLSTGFDPIDESAAFTTLSQAQKAVGYDQKVTQIGIFLKHDKDRVALRDHLVLSLGKDAEGLEIMTWDEAIPEMVSFIEIDRSFGYLYDVVLFIIVAFGIANTLLMAVMERIRELGLLGAIGLGPKAIAKMVVLETVILSLVAQIIGFGLAYGIHRYLADVGVDLSAIYGSSFETGGVTITDTMLNSEIIPLTWGLATLFVFLMVVLSSAYPAWKASRLDPAQAMRTYE